MNKELINRLKLAVVFAGYSIRVLESGNMYLLRDDPPTMIRMEPADREEVYNRFLPQLKHYETRLLTYLIALANNRQWLYSFKIIIKEGVTKIWLETERHRKVYISSEKVSVAEWQAFLQILPKMLRGHRTKQSSTPSAK